MENNIITKYFVKWIGIDLILMMEDTVYMIKRQNHAEEYSEKMEDLKKRYKNSMIMGGSFGLALLLSIRRYFPSNFSQFSLNRAIIELLLLGGSLFGSTMAVMMGGAKVVHSLKKEYMIKADPDFYSYMESISEKYRINE